jgi:hypothetical protein
MLNTSELYNELAEILTSLTAPTDFSNNLIRIA